MSSNKKRRYGGFGLVEIIATVVTLVVVGALAWNYLFSENARERDSSSVEEIRLQEAPEVNAAKDLDEASRYLLDMDIDEQLDTEEIDSTLSE